MNEIGTNLKKARLLKNLTLKEAGLLLGMSSSTISKYEKGILVPDSQKLISFANAYGVKAISLIKIGIFVHSPYLLFSIDSVKENEV